MSEIGNMPSGESSLRVRVTFNDGTDGSVDRASAACAQSLHYQCEGGGEAGAQHHRKGLETQLLLLDQNSDAHNTPNRLSRLVASACKCSCTTRHRVARARPEVQFLPEAGREEPRT